MKRRIFESIKMKKFIQEAPKIDIHRQMVSHLKLKFGLLDLGYLKIVFIY